MSEATLILGSSRGLGKALANHLKSEGKVVLEAASSLTDQRTESGWSFQCDLASDQAVADFTQRLEKVVVAEQLHLAQFFWVAGVHSKGPFESYPQAAMHGMVDVNFRNPLSIAQFVWQHQLKHSQPAQFVVIASTSGVKPRVDETVYAATKWAQVGFTRSLALENPAKHVQVILVLPGGMQTELYRNEQTPGDFESFLDPVKVARHLLAQTSDFATKPWQNEAFEISIPRGSL